MSIFIKVAILSLNIYGAASVFALEQEVDSIQPKNSLPSLQEKLQIVEEISQESKEFPPQVIKADEKIPPIVQEVKREIFEDDYRINRLEASYYRNVACCWRVSEGWFEVGSSLINVLGLVSGTIFAVDSIANALSPQCKISIGIATAVINGLGLCLKSMQGYARTFAEKREKQEQEKENEMIHNAQQMV